MSWEYTDSRRLKSEHDKRQRHRQMSNQDENVKRKTAWIYAQRLEASQLALQSFLCFDVEATCRPGREFDWPNEIIVSVSPSLQMLLRSRAESGRAAY